MKPTAPHNFWRHPWLFRLALVGAVISLSNVFSFPLAVRTGGGPFVLSYLAAHFMLALPIIMAELLVGRRARMSLPHGLALLAAESFVSQRWRYLGVVIVITGLVVAAYFLVFSAWSLDFLLSSTEQSLPGNNLDARRILAELLANFPQQLAVFLALVGLTLLALALPAHWGVQLPLVIMAGGLVLGVLILLLYAGTQGVLVSGFTQVFGPGQGWSLAVLADAVLLSFYSLGLGLGMALVVGMHMDEGLSIGQSAAWVVLVDFLWSVTMAVVVLGFLPGDIKADPLSLVFVDLPLALAPLPGGLGGVRLIYAVLLFAGWSTGLLLIKHAVMWLSERYRYAGGLASALAMWAVGLLGAVLLLSLTRWRDVRLYNWTIMDWVSTLPSQLIIPAVAFLLVVFVVWVYPADIAQRALRLSTRQRFSLWRIMLRYVISILLLALMLVQVQAVWQVHWLSQLLLLAMLLGVLSQWQRVRRPFQEKWMTQGPDSL